MTFAVIKTGGKQYRIQKGDKILIEKLAKKEGESFDFNEVLLFANDKSTKIGQPLVSGVKVTGKVLEQGRGKKKIVFKFKSKTRSKKKRGHRQLYTKVEIIKITA